jgi:hypothetical protein
MGKRIGPRYVCAGCGGHKDFYSLKCRACSTTNRPREKACKRCGIIFACKPSHFDRKVYCDKACMAKAYRTVLKGDKNPHFRDKMRTFVCPCCSKSFKDRHDRKYCSRICQATATPERLRKRGRKDLNHDAIVNAFKKLGCQAWDTAQASYGAPDCFVGYLGVLHAIEVKNPHSTYGRSGRSRSQARVNALCDNTIELVSSLNDVLAAIDRWKSEARLKCDEPHNEGVPVVVWLTQADVCASFGVTGGN